MKSGFTAAAALALALAATTASAGVVISEQVVVNNQGSVQKTEQTVMVQGHKQIVINGDEEQLITDLDAGSIYLITPKTRQFSSAHDSTRRTACDENGAGRIRHRTKKHRRHF